MKRITTAFILMTLLAFTFSGCGNQQKEDSWKEVQKKGEFVLGLDDSFPPMGYRDENGEITGFDIDLAKEVCARLQINLKVQPISWDAKEQELNTKNIDCIWNGLTITEERKRPFYLVNPIWITVRFWSYGRIPSLIPSRIWQERDWDYRPDPALWTP